MRAAVRYRVGPGAAYLGRARSPGPRRRYLRLYAATSAFEGDADGRYAGHGGQRDDHPQAMGWLGGGALTPVSGVLRVAARHGVRSVVCGHGRPGLPPLVGSAPVDDGAGRRMRVAITWWQFARAQRAATRAASATPSSGRSSRSSRSGCGSGCAATPPGRSRGRPRTRPASPGRVADDSAAPVATDRRPDHGRRRPGPGRIQPDACSSAWPTRTTSDGAGTERQRRSPARCCDTGSPPTRSGSCCWCWPVSPGRCIGRQARFPRFGLPLGLVRPRLLLPGLPRPGVRPVPTRAVAPAAAVRDARGGPAARADIRDRASGQPVRRTHAPVVQGH